MKQKQLFNWKGAGRPAKVDKGIRHTVREEFKRLSVLHLTIKIEKDKANIKNKQVLHLLKNAIKKARIVGLRIIHFTLEYDHVHLLVEADSKEILGKGMQSFGICFSKGINKLKNAAGRVYKNRYHFRKLKSPTEIKNVVNYILGNSIKHKSSSFINQYNSLVGMRDFSQLYPGFEIGLDYTINQSKFLSLLRDELRELLPRPRSFHLQKLS